MKIDEAIARLQDHFRVHDDGRPTPLLDEACREAFKALEKQIPIEPIGQYKVCPKCGVIEFGLNEPNYCEWCGQKLKWE